MSFGRERLDVQSARNPLNTLRLESIPMPIPDSNPERRGRAKGPPNNTLHQTGATGPVGRRGASKCGAGW
jgi:hypothetical protein